MSRMTFLYAEAPAPKRSRFKIALQLLLAVEILTFCGVILVHGV